MDAALVELIGGQDGVDGAAKGAVEIHNHERVA